MSEGGKHSRDEVRLRAKQTETRETILFLYYKCDGKINLMLMCKLQAYSFHSLFFLFFYNIQTPPRRGGTEVVRSPAAKSASTRHTLRRDN